MSVRLLWIGLGLVSLGCASATPVRLTQPVTSTKADLPAERDIAQPVRPQATEEPLAPVHFDTGSCELLPTVANIDALQRALDSMRAEAEPRRLRIVGHTDEVGPERLNAHLSLARANAAAIWFTARGIPQERIVIVGLGPAYPVAPNDTAEGRQRNRRVEFRIETGEKRSADLPDRMPTRMALDR